MTDRGLKVLAAVAANAAAALAGFGGAAATGFRLPWSILAAVVAGTLGWMLGSALAVPLVAWLRTQRYAASGRPAYRLRDLPPTETAARSLPWISWSTALTSAFNAGRSTFSLPSAISR